MFSPLGTALASGSDDESGGSRTRAMASRLGADRGPARTSKFPLRPLDVKVKLWVVRD